MNTKIQHTADQLIREAAKRGALSDSDDPEMLLAATIRDLYPSESDGYVRNAVLINSLDVLIDRMKHRAATEENEFLRIGQMPLLGIESYTMPRTLMGSPYLEGHDWCQERLRLSEENTAEMERALKAQRRREERDRVRAENDERLYHILTDNGIDLNGVTYEQAVKIAQTLNPGDDALSQPKAGRTVRPVRTSNRARRGDAD